MGGRAGFAALRFTRPLSFDDWGRVESIIFVLRSLAVPTVHRHFLNKPCRSDEQ